MENKNSLYTRRALGVVAILIAMYFAVTFIKDTFSFFNPETPTPTVKTKEIKGSSEITKPTQNVITSVKGKSAKDFIKSDNSNRAFYEAEINKLLSDIENLKESFSNASDSTKLDLYNKVIAVKSYSKDFDDEFIHINSSGLISNGEIQTMKFDYKIKSQEIEIPKQKEVVFRMLAGIEVGNNTQFNSLNAKVNIGFQNRKGNIISVSADMEQRYYLGYTVKIFQIRGK